LGAKPTGNNTDSASNKNYEIASAKRQNASTGDQAEACGVGGDSIRSEFTVRNLRPLFANSMMTTAALARLVES
jgi:hypothetical protein